MGLQVWDPGQKKMVAGVLTANGGVKPMQQVAKQAKPTTGVGSAPKKVPGAGMATRAAKKQSSLSDERIGEIVELVGKAAESITKMADSNANRVAMKEQLEKASAQLSSFPIHAASDFGVTFLTATKEILKTIADGEIEGTLKDHRVRVGKIVEALDPIVREIKQSLPRSVPDVASAFS